ncbi:hypothetical protein [Allocoleopsis sp.]|uniref:hypothetical protein n=1 Tax=Allocoleopsis sp. TaxID=3088169 RepID=UPI002FD522C4
MLAAEPLNSDQLITIFWWCQSNSDMFFVHGLLLTAHGSRLTGEYSSLGAWRFFRTD